MTWLNVKNIEKKYSMGSQELYALKDISFNMPKGELITIVGKSGSGKTTLLRILAGLSKQTAGNITVDGQSQNNGKPLRCGMVFQEPRLMPWLNVKENIMFSMHQKDENCTAHNIDDLLLLLGLNSFRKFYPIQLSGGMAQRTAVGRALYGKPELILMDEPFSSLDYFTRRILQKKFIALHLKYNNNVLFVTHDIEEALFLGQRIFIMDKGSIIGILPFCQPYPRYQNSDVFFAMWKQILAILERGSA